MNVTSKTKMCFNNYPEAKAALGKVTYPCMIKPYECNDPHYCYLVEEYGKAIQKLYDAFEHSSNNLVVIEYSE